jgi:hypothetical protein
VLKLYTTSGESDPVIVWPDAEPKLRTLIAGLQSLNPALDLRCAITPFLEFDETYLLIDAAGAKHWQKKRLAVREIECLIYRGTALDLVTLAIPAPISNDVFYQICAANGGFRRLETDLGVLRTGPRRIERISSESMRIRPCSPIVQDAVNAFIQSYEMSTSSDDGQAGKLEMHGPWSVFAEDEIWSVDIACLPAGHRLAAEGRPKAHHEWLQTPLLGVISYIDKDDLSMEDHMLRARIAVVTGCAFAIVADIERGELRIVQSSEVVVSQPVRLPQISKFDIPVGRRA